MCRAQTSSPVVSGYIYDSYLPHERWDALHFHDYVFVVFFLLGMSPFLWHWFIMVPPIDIRTISRQLFVRSFIDCPTRSRAFVHLHCSVAGTHDLCLPSLCIHFALPLSHAGCVPTLRSSTRRARAAATSSITRRAKRPSSSAFKLIARTAPRTWIGPAYRFGARTKPNGWSPRNLFPCGRGLPWDRYCRLADVVSTVPVWVVERPMQAVSSLCGWNGGHVSSDELHWRRFLCF